MNRFARLISIPVFIAFLAAQSVPRDEIRSSTVPYVPPSMVTLRTEVRLVEVPLVVRDSQHRAIAGLSKDDFEISDEGKKQLISNFSVVSFASSRAATADTSSTTGETRTRYIALCFDDLHLDLNALKPAKEAAIRFVETSLRTGDQAIIATTSHSQSYEFTSDPKKLIEQIQKVIPAPQGVSDNFESCPNISPYDAYQIVNSLDAGNRILNAKIEECKICEKPPPNAADMVCPASQIVALARGVWAHTRSNSDSTLGVIEGLVDGMVKLPGERMILLTSAGFFMGTLESAVDHVIDKALHAQVVINTLDAKGLYASEGAEWQGLAALAQGTGGAFYHNNNDLKRGFDQLGMAPETMYLLSFTPSEKPDGRYHRLKIRLIGDKQYTLQARLGYEATQPKKEAAESSGSALDREVMASDAIADLPVSFTWEQWAGPPGITMIARLDIRRLHFTPWQGRQTQKLVIVGVVLDSQDRFVAGKRSEMELSFRDATFKSFEKDGFPVAFTIQAPPGNYSVRAVAQDAFDGKLAAASQEVKIQ